MHHNHQGPFAMLEIFLAFSYSRNLKITGCFIGLQIALNLLKCVFFKIARIPCLSKIRPDHCYIKVELTLP